LKHGPEKPEKHKQNVITFNELLGKKNFPNGSSVFPCHTIPPSLQRSERRWLMLKGLGSGQIAPISGCHGFKTFTPAK
jgi:hypothetical protein